ncbi:hypothetical protein UABAM_02905 [Candidatus Uabimicrobium amorphum]|uniref:Uncharacterized protein n=1 Tax=Uabimicrobium amorphum TaxID=2596890 RepID=A0A5S9F4J3_UABAM|nr:hypothetical protein UABAM_02905 [Candidatus Uabimicrobium amorphum]
MSLDMRMCNLKHFPKGDIMKIESLKQIKVRMKFRMSREKFTTSKSTCRFITVEKKSDYDIITLSRIHKISELEGSNII